MNLHHLRVFHTVAHSENFSQAAQQLYISQPAVSVQVRRLEEALGVPLVEVYGRRVHLTSAGIRLREYADRIFRLERDAEAAMLEAREPGQGLIRLGASTTPGTYLLPRLVAAFRRQWPGIRMELELGNTRSVEERLLRNDLDLGIVGEDLTGGHELLLEPWIADRMVIIAPPQGAWLSGPVPLERVLEAPFILREPGSSTREVFSTWMQTRGLQVAPALQLASTEAVKEAVAAGLGLAVVSELAVRSDLAVGRLALVEVAGLRLERRFHLARHRAKRLPTAGEAFLDHLRAQVV